MGRTQIRRLEMSKELTLFDNFWSNFPSSVFESPELFKGLPDGFEKIMNGKCDFEEMDDRYEIELEVPGVKKNEIDVNLQNDILTVSWSRRRDEKKGLLKKKTIERSEGSFSRSFSVRGADSDRISAELKSGVLKLNLPKEDDFKPRRIQIN